MLAPHARLDLDRRRSDDGLQAAEEGLEPRVLELEAARLVHKLLVQLRGRGCPRARELDELGPQRVRERLGHLAALEQGDEQVARSVLSKLPRERKLRRRRAAHIFERGHENFADCFHHVLLREPRLSGPSLVGRRVAALLARRLVRLFSCRAHNRANS